MENSPKRLSFKSREEEGILYLETKERHVSYWDAECHAYEVTYKTEVTVLKSDKIYVNIGSLSFVLDTNEEYEELISFFKGIKNHIDKFQMCSGELFGIYSCWTDENYIKINIGNKVVCGSTFSRYIFADIVKYLETR